MQRMFVYFISTLWITYSSAADNNVCSTSLWSTGKLTTNMIKVSSNNNDLDKIKPSNSSASQGWCGTNGNNSNIQIDFPSAVGVGGIVLQEPRIDIKKILVQFVGDGNQVWQSFREQDVAHNSKAPGTRYIYTLNWPGQVMTKLKINILQFENVPCLQVDVLGCLVSELCPDGCKHGGKCVQQNKCACTADFSGDFCEIAGKPLGACMQRQGMENGQLPKNNLAASSFAPLHDKEKARLNCCEGEEVGGWCANTGDVHPWYEVRFSKATSFAGIEFQPPARKDVYQNYTNFVKNFTLKYISSQDPLKSWRTFADNVPGIANSSVAKMTITLQPRVTVDAVRIYPTVWSTRPCMRIEILGCDPSTLCTADFCKNDGKCISKNMCQCKKGFYGTQCEAAASKLTTYSIRFVSITSTTITTSVNVAFQITGKVTLIPSHSGHVLAIKGENSYVTVSGSGFDSCIQDIDTCINGYTLNIQVNFQTIQDHTYIVSTGGDLPQGKGLALYYNKGKIYYIVSTTTHVWKIETTYTFKADVWNHFELSWSRTLGIEIINNGQLIGSAIKWLLRQPGTYISHKLTIGYGFHQAKVNVSILVQGLQTFDIQRSEVVHQDLLTTTTSTSTTETPSQSTKPAVSPSSSQPQGPVSNCTLSNRPIQTINLAFIGIVNDVLITPLHNFTVHGHPFLEPENNGEAILILNKTGHYIELPNTGVECLQDLTTCDKGFTLKVEIRIYKVITTDKNYIFSSGGDQLETSGIALYLWKGELYCSIKWNKQIWAAKKRLTVQDNEWHSYQVSWNEKDGFIVFIDGVLFMEHRIRLPNPAQDETHPLLIAKGFGSNVTTLMDIRDLYAWTASRDILICEHVLQEFTTLKPTSSPTTTTTATTSTTKIPTTTTTTPTTTTTTEQPTTTTAVNIPTYEWNFSHLIGNTFIQGNNFKATVHGGATINATTNSLHITNTSQYVDFGSHTNLCLSNLDLCTQGVTFEIAVHFSKLEENTVIMTSGGENPDGTGIALVYKFGSIHCVISQSTYSWFAIIPREKINFQTFASILVSWKPDKGLILYLGNTIIDYSTRKIPHHPITTSTQHLFLGPAPTSTLVTSSVSINFYLQSFKCWHIWIDIAIEIGIIIRPPSSATTGRPVTTIATTVKAPEPSTKVTTAKPTTVKLTTQHSTKPVMSTQTCHAGWICKDDLTTLPPTTTQKVTTRKTTTTTTTPKPTKPGLPSYTRPPTLTTGVDGNNMAFFICHFTKTVEQNVEMIVTLNINGVPKNMFIVPGFSDQYKFTIDKINENLKDKKITCSIQARFIGQNELTTKLTSNTISPSITLITTSKITLTEGKTTPQIIQVNTTAPPQMFCCSGCKGQCTVTIQAHLNYDRHDTTCNGLIIPQMVVGWKGPSQSSKAETCGTVMQQINWNQIIEIPVSATVDNLYDRDHSNTFTVHAQVENRPQPPSISVSTTQAFTVGSVQVVAKDNDHKSMCTSLNDPHITTFDGRRYDNFHIGEFTLYKHKELPYEVRALYQYCSNSRHRTRPTCNCAVAIKSGDDVITFSSCAEYAVYSRHHRHGPAPITIKLYKNGELTPGTRIRRLGSGQKYEVHLPTGTIVTVQSSARPFINIWVKPSSVDYHRTEGLCGLYDRNRNNDVIDNNGRPINDRHPDQFSLKWKTSSSIFTGVAVSTVPGVTMFCSCVQGKQTFCIGGHSVMRCLEKRYDITSTIISQARAPILRHRTKRQADNAQGQGVNVLQNNKNYTEKEAKDECRRYITGSPATGSCSKVVNSSDVEERILNCAVDLIATGDDVWAADSVKDIVEECLAEAARSPPDINSNAPDVNSTDLCTENCGKNGHCEEGVCQCNNGYSGLNCSLSRSTKSTVVTINEQDGCDTRLTDNSCDTAVIHGADFVQSDDLTCHYQYVTVSNKVVPYGSIQTTPADFVNMYQVNCQLPENSRSAYIWISNDGTTKSDDFYLHLVYDSKCFDCEFENNTENSHCARLDNTCIINGDCFVADETEKSNKYKKCDPSSSTSTWTDTCSEDPTCNGEIQASKQNVEEDMDRTQIIILAVVCGVFGLGLIIAVVYICKIRSKIKGHKEMGSYNISKRREEYLANPTSKYDNPAYHF